MWALRKSVILCEHALKGNGDKLAREFLIALLNLTPLGETFVSVMYEVEVDSRT